MFDLNEQMQNWRDRLCSAETMRPADVDELEQHLHDAIAALTAKGLSEEEAFVVAIHRIGKPQAVAGEFRKLNGCYVWAHRAFWMLSGYMLVQVANGAVVAVAALGEVLAAYAGGSGTVVGLASIGITLLGWLAMLATFYRWTRSSREGTSFFRMPRRSIAYIAVAIVIAQIIARAVQIGSQVALLQLISNPDFIQALLMVRYSREVAVLLLPLLLMAAALHLRQTTTRELAT